MTSLVVGAGEVGTSLSRVLRCRVRDVEPLDDDPNEVDVLHIAYGWSDRFVEFTRAYEQHYRPRIVVVHSTVAVGTCDAHGWVHSPVRGRHPDLTNALKTFIKHFGGVHAERAARDWRRTVRSGTVVHAHAKTCEAGKLWELVQLGLQVVVEQEIHDWCTKRGLDPVQVYGAFATTYNDGYRQLGHGRFVRPILNHQPGAIGGHCVRENAPLVGHPLADLVAAWDGDAQLADRLYE